MNLDNVTVELRPRSEWEAADFGVRMVRRDAGAIYAVWFAITLPLLALALLGILYGPFPTLASLAYWWLEPLADGPILRIISRRLFGEEADVSATLRAAPVLAWRNRIFLLSPYRFHIARSIAMPITQLEGLRGKARRARAKVLNQKVLNYGTGITVAYQHLLAALYLGVILIGFALVPTEYQSTIGLDWMNQFSFDSDTRAAAATSLLAFYFAQTLLEPWFVGAGFGLYINCRTQLEAWDIEVAFRRMVQRRSAGLAAALCVFVLVAGPAFMPNTAAAADAPDASGPGTESDPGIAGYWSDDEIRPAVNAVLAKDALQTTREVEYWRATNPQQPRQASGNGAWLFRLLDGIGRLIAFVVEFSLWFLAAFALFLLYATRDRWLPYLRGLPARATDSPRISLAGGELTSERLPGDIPGEARRLWELGAKREALALLYRGSVFAAVMRDGVRLPPSATEDACVAAVERQTDATKSEFFRGIVSVWVRCAYGGYEPDDAAVLPICSAWAGHFGAAV